MKTLISTLALCFASFISIAQQNGASDSARKAVDSIALHFEDSVRNRLFTAKSGLDTVSYGLVAMTGDVHRKKRFLVYSKNKRDSMYVTVERIDIVIEEWQIVRCFVKTEKGIFQNRYPISLLYYNQGRFGNAHPRRNDLLFFTDLNDVKYQLPIGRVLDFAPSPRHRVSMMDYDISLLPDSSSFAYPLRAVPIADNIINFSIFTDVIGLFGEPNGLVQFEADAYIPITQGNMRNSSLFWLRSIRPYFDLIRMDKEFQVTDVRTDILDKKLADSTVPKLFRQAFLIGGLDLNLFSGMIGTNNFNVFGGGEFRQSKVLLRDNDKQSANMMTAYGGANFTTRAFENFRIGADFRWYFWSRMVSAEEYTGKYMHWLISSVNICYFPPFRPASKIFLRLTYNNTPTFPGSDFMQVQVGYKTPLSGRVKTNMN
jgi:hypothetical protein